MGRHPARMYLAKDLKQSFQSTGLQGQCDNLEGGKPGSRRRREGRGKEGITQIFRKFSKGRAE